MPLDSGEFQVDTHLVGALPNRLSIPDTRGRRAYLQVTRHSDQRKVVLSQWRDGICVASTPLDVSELPALIGVLAEAMGDAVALPHPVANRKDRRPSRWLTKYFRPTLARIVELPNLRDHWQEDSK